MLCTACLADLPLARFHDDPENRVEQLFKGRVNLRAASSFLLFNRSGVAQRLLHRLKYKADTPIGRELGRMMATDIQDSERFKKIDILLAVPLHRSKERRRGFNQSQVIIEGMQQILHLPSLRNELIRIESTGSQTRRGRIARWHNVKEAFAVRDPEKFRDKHILLVDDVVTTGATIEACVNALGTVPGIAVSLYTAACA